MLRLELKNVVKYHQDRLILNITDLRIYDHDIVGIVGLNGSGKTTLLNIMSGQMGPDEGIVKMYGRYSYITQFDKSRHQIEQIDSVVASRFNLPDRYEEHMSGGEKTRFKIASALSNRGEVILADEPTANLDLDGIQLFEDTLKQFPGTVLIVSHDREMLDKLCNKILEVENGRVKLYNGNYSSYLNQKEQERNRQEFEYHQFVKERSRLKEALAAKKQQSRSIKKTPRRMGNSEARLHKMGNQKAIAAIDRSVKAIESRISKLEQKEKPTYFTRVRVDLLHSGKFHSQVVIEGKNINKGYGQKAIFRDACFQLRNGEKTAIIGENGSGKTTLIKMILNCEAGIKAAKNLKIGYFSQDMDILDDHKTIIENLMEYNVYDEAFTRIILARLLFKRDDVYKKVSVLSGGEKVRASFAKIILSDFNMLVLDEPTNYLDIYSLEAVEEVLVDYPGNLLFVSHDRKFVNKIATNILFIKNKKLVPFQGNCEQYLHRVADQDEKQGREHRMLLQHRLSEIIGRLALPSKNDDIELLDREYKRILSQFRELD